MGTTAYPRPRVVGPAGHVLERVMASQTRVGAPPLRGLFQESSGCQNPAQEGSDMMRASQERAPLAVGCVGTTWSVSWHPMPGLTLGHLPCMAYSIQDHPDGSCGRQNPAQEGSDMMRASQERAPLAIG